MHQNQLLIKNLREEMHERINEDFDIIYMDIDGAEINEEYIQVMLKEWRGRIEVYITKHGYHIKWYPRTPVPAPIILYAMHRMHCDPMAIWQWLRTGEQTLYRTRRGHVNAHLLQTWEL